MISIIYSIFNRTALFERGLKSLEYQSLPKDDFEIIVVDDESDEDVKDLLRKFNYNIRYIRYDHTLSPIYKEMNPEGGDDWYHTQAISGNIGIGKAKGEVILITQPEIIHSPKSLEIGYKRALEGYQVFGETIMATETFNEKLEKAGMNHFDWLMEDVENIGYEYVFQHMPPHYEMYWFIEYLPTQVARDIGGIDLKYQKGVYAEDDQFKIRARMAGCPDVWGGRPDLKGDAGNYIVGIHQSHRHENHKRQQRDGSFWNAGANHNRNLLREFQEHPYIVANEGINPWGDDLIIEDIIL